MATPTIEATQMAIASAFLLLIFDDSATSTTETTGAITSPAIWVIGLKPSPENATASSTRPTASTAFTM